MLLEAMASRNFCVVTATGGSAEICNHMQTGYLCSDPTPLEISKGIVWYLDNRSEGDDIAETAMSLIRSDYSMNKMASRFHNIVNTHGPMH
jgi:glycosyltransferase involved in cell wall biosynthesis